MRLFFVRHAETVDNVAQLLGGTRDAELTNHGHQQAYRLGEYLQKEGIFITRILSSTKSRAIKTSEQIIQGQKHQFRDFGATISITHLLVERDFGSLEGRSWTNQPSRKVSRRNQRCSSRLSNDQLRATYVPKESKQSLQYRADSFVDLHLIPTLRTVSNVDNSVIIVVSHGIILKYVLRQFALRLPTRSLFLGVREESNIIDLKSLDDLCQWSNTGYVELRFERSKCTSYERDYASSGDSGEEAVRSGAKSTSSGSGSSNVGNCENKPIERHDTRPGIGIETDNSGAWDKPTSANNLFPNSWVTLVETVNGTDHLRSLKRTGGGIGSAKYDKKQKTLNGFLKY